MPDTLLAPDGSQATPEPGNTTPPQPSAPAADPAPPAPAPDPAPAPAPAPEPAPEPDIQTPKWREDWREALAGGDEKRLRQLQRYADPMAFANKTFSLEAKLASGEYKRPTPPDNATPEEVAEWRKEQGLPETPEDYKPELPDGVVLGETDKATLEGFQKFAFDNNMSPDALNKTLGWYFAEQDRLTQERELADADFHESSKDALISEWGVKDYRDNLNAMGAVRDQMPQGLADRILAGRTADGRLIGDDPVFLQWFASLAREINPVATVIPQGSGKTLEGELEAIRKLRREDPAAYDADKKMQARELELLDASLKMKARQG